MSKRSAHQWRCERPGWKLPPPPPGPPRPPHTHPSAAVLGTDYLFFLSSWSSRGQGQVHACVRACSVHCVRVTSDSGSTFRFMGWWLSKMCSFEPIYIWHEMSTKCSSNNTKASVRLPAVKWHQATAPHVGNLHPGRSVINPEVDAGCSTGGGPGVSPRTALIGGFVCI